MAKINQITLNIIKISNNNNSNNFKIRIKMTFFNNTLNNQVIMAIKVIMISMNIHHINNQEHMVWIRSMKKKIIAK